MKTCTKCLKEKNNNEFDFQRAQCKSCRYEYKKSLPKLDNDVLVTKQKCSCCNIIKSAKDFHPERTRVTGLYPYCRECSLEKQKQKYNRNPEKYKQKSNEYYHSVKNDENFKMLRREAASKKLQTNIFHKVKRNLRNRLYYAIQNKTWKKNTHFTEYIGCDKDILIKHIESQFQSGMTWDNYAHDTWHIDHIIPLDSARNESELYKLCHYTNLRPLFAKDNIKKGNKIE